MPLRMAEYCLRIYRSTGKMPRQILLYVGQAPLQMQPTLSGPALSYQYQIIEIRSLKGDDLLASPNIGDNVLAVLGRLPSKHRAVREILTRIAAQEPPERDVLLRQLLILAGLRRLEEVIEGEAKKMPLLDSILDNRVLGREYKRGRQEGRQEAELAVLRSQIQKRFGPLTESAEQKLTTLPEPELLDLAIRLLDAQSLDELLR